MNFDAARLILPLSSQEATVIETLQSKLDALRVSRCERLAWSESYEEMLSQLGQSGFLEQVIKPGEYFPDFMLPSAEGQLLSLAAFLAHGPVIISFFRGEWCPFCRLMLAALTEALPQISAAGATLLALTPETGGLALKMKTYHGAPFEILADVDCGIGLAAGVVFKIPPKYRALLGPNFPDRHGNSGWYLPIPASFILSQDGRIAWRFADVDFSHRPEPADIIRAVANMNGKL
ncbi:MAG: peroxiredoxin-like family protein [Acidocella sp.]|nr:peroxiredoxin-like family protein [Acidocella sp.]